jgi:Bacterial protein of unknown function (DUF899)
MRIAFPGESNEYRAARDRLLEQEIELRRDMEAVAAARRNCRSAELSVKTMSFKSKDREASRPTCDWPDAVGGGKDGASVAELERVGRLSGLEEVDARISRAMQLHVGRSTA